MLQKKKVCFPFKISQTLDPAADMEKYDDKVSNKKIMLSKKKIDKLVNFTNELN